MEPPAEVEVAGPLTVQATRLWWEEGVAFAEGEVVVSWGEERVTAARATWSPGRLVLEDGAWTRAEGTLRFARAELVAGEARFEAAAVDAGGPRLLAARLGIPEEGDWSAEGVEVWPCACPDGGDPALSLRAREARLAPDRVVVARGVTVRLFGVAVGWAPRLAVSLAPERFRVGVPEVGWGDEGLVLAWSGGATLDGWRLRGGPALLSERGVRGRVEVDGPWAAGRGDLGWDWKEAAWRGALRTTGGVHRSTRLGWEVDAVTDPAWGDDYDVDYVSRGVAWRESRLTAGWGPERLTVHLPDDGGVDARVTQRLRYELGGPVAVAPRAELGWVGSTGSGEGQGVALGGLDARLRHTLGPVSVGGAGDAGGWLGTAGEAGAFARGGAEGALALWGEVGRTRVQGWVGGRATGEAATGPASFGDGLAVRVLDPPPPWAAGPYGRAETVLGATVISAEAWARWTDAGFEPSGQARVSGGPWSLEAGAEPERQWGRGAARLGALSAGVGGVHEGEVALAWGEADLAPGRARVGGSLAWDLAAGSWSGADARVGYDDGCVAIGLRAGFSPDRALPDLGLAAEVRGGRRGRGVAPDPSVPQSRQAIVEPGEPASPLSPQK